MSDRTYEDCFNMLCGDLIGRGIHRKVFKCKLRPDLVVKVEYDDNDLRNFSNVMEDKFWSDMQHAPKVAKWLAPIEFLSPDGRLLLQRKVKPIADDDKLPDKLPAFLTDIKRDNFGWIGKNLVCVDYAFHIDNISERLIKANWD